jgi:hypothetical protein
MKGSKCPLVKFENKPEILFGEEECFQLALGQCSPLY